MCAATDDLEDLRQYVNSETVKRLEADIKMATHISDILDELRKLQERVSLLEKRVIN